MASRRFSQKPPVDLCAEWTSDDGIDPRLMPRRPQGRVTNRKTLQLCRQVERILSSVLEGDVLRDLSVSSVQPAPDSSRLLVTVVHHGSPTLPTAEVLAALEQAHAALRREVANAIHRRKTPELTFHVLRG
jgi:ribosome-binding factor A